MKAFIGLRTLEVSCVGAGWASRPRRVTALPANVVWRVWAGLPHLEYSVWLVSAGGGVITIRWPLGKVAMLDSARAPQSRIKLSISINKVAAYVLPKGWVWTKCRVSSPHFVVSTIFFILVITPASSVPAPPITHDTRISVPISARGQRCVVDTLGAGDAGHGEIFICPVKKVIGAIIFNILEVIITITIISDGDGWHVVLSGDCRTS